ncbi:MAG TPA: RagB/SusD family nutrient uptake outer membrane protein [Puia sp.]
MKKKLIIITAGLVGLVFSSCQKNFLDKYPQTVISPQLFFNTEDDLSEYVNGLLNQAGTGQYTADQSSDNLATTGSIEVKNIMTGTPTSQTITTGWSFTRLRNINYFLENYSKAAVGQDVKDHYAGLARYYRADFYMGMVKRYSDVPWYSGTLSPDDSTALYMARTPRAQVVDSILSDLQFASAHVRENVPAGTPGIWAVMTRYASMALYEGTFRKYHPELKLQDFNVLLDTASAVASRIMAGGKYHLASDYSALFGSADLSSNPEVILNTPYDLTVKGAQSSNNNTGLWGDYEQSVARDLIQSYLMKDGSRFTDINGYQQFTFVQEFQNRDPRLMQTMVYPGYKRVQDVTPYVQRLNKNFTGYHQIKGYVNSTDNTVIGSADFPAIRYADVLLTYAEALAEKGEITQADLDKSVNLVRARAGIPALNLAAANANPDAVLAAKYPDVAGANKGVILEIRRERRIEFAVEGYRYDDLMRWHAGSLLAAIPEGMYFPGLGQFDMTGDGVADIMLIGKDDAIPADANKVKNSLGVPLVYYNAGSFGDNVTVYLRNGTSGGTLVTELTPRQFLDPKYYYRPVPYLQTQLSPNVKQIFGW